MRREYAIFLAVAAIFMACSKTTNPPSVPPIAITNPPNGATLLDPTIIVATVGSGFTFRAVDFFIDDALVSTDSVAPYTYYWNIFAYPSGSNHTIHAIGYVDSTSQQSPTVLVNIEYTTGFSFVSNYHQPSLNAQGVTSYYSLLFVCTGDAGVEVLDISNIYSPVYLSRFDTHGWATHAAVLYPDIFVADRDQGVQRADFSNVDTLIGTGRYSTGSFCNDVAISSDLLFVAEDGAFSVVGTSNPDTLVPLSRVMFPSDILNYVVARADTAFAVGNNSFYVLDCINPSSPVIVATYDNLTLAKGVAVADTFAFLANGADGVLALSIANPAAPRFLARFNPGQIITTVAVGESTLFVGAQVGVVYAVDYSQPDTLVSISQFNQNNQVREIHFQWPYVFVAATSTVEILRFVR